MASFVLTVGDGADNCDGVNRHDVRGQPKGALDVQGY